MNDTTWRSRAACRNIVPPAEPERLPGLVPEPMDDDALAVWRTKLFYPAEVTVPRRPRTKGRRYDEPKAVCAGCDVRAECMEFAMATNEPFGIWGGLDEEERRALRVARRSTAA